MKKVLCLTLFLILFVCTALCCNTYAAELDCSIEIKTDKVEYSKDDIFIANVYISNIQSEKGVIALEAVLNYNKDDLTILEMNGKNSWDTPENDVSYNESTGKMALTRSRLGKNDEIIFEIKFKVNNTNASTTSIELKDITVANGFDTPKAIETINNTITIKAKETNNTPANSTENTNTNTNSNTNTSTSNNTTNTNTNANTNTSNNTNTNKNTNTNSSKNTNTNNTNKNTVTTNTNKTDNTIKSSGSIPKTGMIQDPFCMILMTIVIGSALYFYIRIQLINKKANK